VDWTFPVKISKGDCADKKALPAPGMFVLVREFERDFMIEDHFSTMGMIERSLNMNPET
jgi:hypothetical protein